MRRALALVPCLLVLTASLAAPPSGAGQSARRTDLAGRWSYLGAASNGERIVTDAVEPVIAQLPPDIQQIARERIAESTWLPTTVRIGARRGQLRVDLRGQQRRTFAGAPGATIQVPMRHGYAQLVQTLRPDGALQQDFTAIDGVQRNVFVPGPNGTMVLDVTMRSPTLPTDIHFQLQYRRAR